jgi:hypothetical protein
MVPLLANVPISRLFDEMIKLLQTGHALASIEQLKRFGLVGGGPIFPVLDAALARPRPTRRARPSCAWRWRTPTAVWPRAARWRRASCWPACCGTTCRSAGGDQGASRRGAVPGAAAGRRRGVRCPHRRHLRPRQAGRRHARDLADAAALRAPHAQRRGRWRRSRASAPATTSCACAPMPARPAANWPTGGRTSTSAATTSARRCWPT